MAKYTVIAPNLFAAGENEALAIGAVIELTDKQAAARVGKVEPVTVEAEPVVVKTKATPQAPTTKRRGRPPRKAKAAG